MYRRSYGASTIKTLYLVCQAGLALLIALTMQQCASQSFGGERRQGGSRKSFPRLAQITAHGQSSGLLPWFRAVEMRFGRAKSPNLAGNRAEKRFWLLALGFWLLAAVPPNAVFVGWGCCDARIVVFRKPRRAKPARLGHPHKWNQNGRSSSARELPDYSIPRLPDP